RPSRRAPRTRTSAADAGSQARCRAALLRHGRARYPARARPARWVGMEASPSPVYGAALLMRFGFIAHRGFKSLRLRRTRKSPDTLFVGALSRASNARDVGGVCWRVRNEPIRRRRLPPPP